MAVDSWIKLRTKLPNDGRLRIASRKCHAPTVTALGALVTLWCFADAHADADGVLLGYTAEDVDAMVGVPGFCAALPPDWIDLGGEWVKLPEYQEHNGTTAKSRAQATKRKSHERSVTAVANVSRTKRDTSVTRVEKSREELEAPLSPARADAPDDDPPSVVVIDGQTGLPSTAPPSSLAALTPDQAKQAVLACTALRRMGAPPRIHPGDEVLAALMTEGFTAEQVVRCVGEKALRDASLFNDPDLTPELPELLINGAKQQAMGLTDTQHTALRSAVAQVSIAYIAATLRGRRRDATQPTGIPHGKSTHPANGGAGAPRSAVERVRAANEAAERREAAEREGRERGR